MAYINVYTFLVHYEDEPVKYNPWEKSEYQMSPGITCVCRAPQTYFQEMGFNLPTVLASLFFCWGIEYVFSWDSCICNSLVVAEHPDEHIRHRILRLLNDEEY